MSNTTKTYVHSTWVTGGPAIPVGESVIRARRGAVVAVVDGHTLQVGWSLCNRKSGDRFNSEIAKNLAEGRARTQHENSLKFGKKSAPTTAELMSSGIPQSVLSAMGDVITSALKANPDVSAIQIFNTQGKPSTAPTKKLLWAS